MDPASLAEDVSSRIRDLADAVLVLAVCGEAVALWRLWNRIGELIGRVETTQGLRVEDAKESNKAALMALGASRETISAQVQATDRLRDGIERLRESNDGMRGSLDRVWQALEQVAGRTMDRGRPPRSGGG